MTALVKSTIGQVRGDADWNPYEILGLVPPVSEKDIRSAYRRIARVMHPDNGGSVEAFLVLQEAYDFLLDPVRRSLWDRKKIKATDEKRAKALALLKNLCDAVIDSVVNGMTSPEYANIPELMKKELLAKLDKLAMMISDIRRQIGRHKLMINKVTRKGGGDNIVAQVLARRLEEREASIVAIGEEVVIGEIMLAELTAYSSTAEAGPMSPTDRHLGRWNELNMADASFFFGGIRR
ncbi:MAG TPA: J domain-containing protein [Rhizobium sp.]|nr:J domain-containing protein [Rhizobium sp.]